MSKIQKVVQPKLYQLDRQSCPWVVVHKCMNAKWHLSAVNDAVLMGAIVNIQGIVVVNRSLYWLYVTGFGKSRLSCTQHQDTLFTIKRYVYTLTNNLARHWRQSFPGCFCCGLSDVHENLGYLQIAPYLLDKQIARCNSLRLADKFGHEFSCFVRYVEVKMAPMDVIWLF